MYEQHALLRMMGSTGSATPNHRTAHPFDGYHRSRVLSHKLQILRGERQNTMSHLDDHANITACTLTNEMESISDCSALVKCFTVREKTKKARVRGGAPRVVLAGEAPTRSVWTFLITMERKTRIKQNTTSATSTRQHKKFDTNPWLHHHVGGHELMYT